jgi:hypothetical protein
MKNNSFFKTIIFFGILGGVIFIIHFFLHFFLPDFFNAGNILFSHLFLFLITMFAVFTVDFIGRKYHPGMTGFGFLGTSLIKMILAVIYLFPILRGDLPYKISYVVQFFVIYFFYLFAEVLYLSRKFKK